MSPKAASGSKRKCPEEERSELRPQGNRESLLQTRERMFQVESTVFTKAWRQEKVGEGPDFRACHTQPH